MPQLSIIDALGLSMVVSFLTHETWTDAQQESSDERPSYGSAFLRSIRFTTLYYGGGIWMMALVIQTMQG